MRVLLTNNTLAERAGSELYVRDLATALLRRGHQPVAFSTRLGAVAEDLGRATVPVISDLTNLAEPPDVIHGQHHLETMTAVLHFPGVPAVFFCHGWLPWEEIPPRYPSILRYVAVDDTCRDRLVSEWGIPPGQVEVILNFVDLARFRPRSPLPEKPERALVFANSASEATHLPAIRQACLRAGIALEVAGLGSGRVLERPEDALPAFDLVFAKARAALEAMAVGATVIVCDSHGLAERVTSENFDRLRRLNFGVRTLSRRVSVEDLVFEISGYDRADAGAVSARVRAEAGLDAAVARIERVYERVASDAAAAGEGRALGRRELIAAAAYLRWLGPEVKASRHGHARDSVRVAELEAHLEAAARREQILGEERDRLGKERKALLAEGQEAALALEGKRRDEERERDTARVRAIQDDVALREAALKEERTETHSLRAALLRREGEINSIRRTVTWRLRERVFRSGRVVAMYRTLRSLPPAPGPPSSAAAAVPEGREAAGLQERFETIGRTRFLGVPVVGFADSGRMQLIALLQAGLVPASRVLDFGCGCLRGGYWLIHFLEPGRYFGIEPHRERLTLAVENLLEPGLLQAKRPRFDTNPDFDLSVFGETFDFVLAGSIWTHAAKPQIRRMLDSLLRVSHEGTIVLSSYLPAGPDGPDYEGQGWVGTSHQSDVPGVVRHDLRWILEECGRHGLEALELPDPAPDQQRWLRICRA